MSRTPGRIGVSLLVAAWSAESLQAHAISTDLGDFYGGLLHPATAPEHLLPMVALGLLAGQHSPEVGRRGLLLFLIGLAFGLGSSLIDPDWVVPARLNELSILVAGGLVAAAWRLPALLPLLVLVFGWSHGYGNGTALVDGISQGLFLGGVMVSGLILFSLPTGIVIPLKAEWSRVAVRVVGSWIAATGLLLLAVRS